MQKLCTRKKAGSTFVPLVAFTTCNMTSAELFTSLIASDSLSKDSISGPPYLRGNYALTAAETGIKYTLYVF